MHTYATSNLTWYFHGRFRTFPTALFDHSFVSASSSLELEPGEICSLETWKHNETYIQKARICFHQVWPSMGTSSVKVWGGSWEQTTVWVQNQFGFGSELKHVLCLLNNCWRINDWSTFGHFLWPGNYVKTWLLFRGGFWGFLLRGADPSDVFPPATPLSGPESSEESIHLTAKDKLQSFARRITTSQWFGMEGDPESGNVWLKCQAHFLEQSSRSPRFWDNRKTGPAYSLLSYDWIFNIWLWNS